MKKQLLRRNTIISILFLSFVTFFLAFCNRETSISVNNSNYLNLADSVSYVGMETCKSCHLNVYNTFIKTGMGRSFDHATLEKTDARFDKHAIVYDSVSNFYYKPFFKDSSMYVMEYRLENKDTIHKRIEKISYIIGSGQHTNSHIIDINGYIYQAPITFYTQKGKWDLAPGFEDHNTRFSRVLTTECITCHNHLPDPIQGSLNKYEKMPRGIECERCHGPGEIHVREKLSGNIVDTSKYIDYSIVNPADLSRDRQMDICQRCHLQGIAVLEEGKTFFDFKPGMSLSDVFNVFLPRYTADHENFIMASQADRLQMSDCFKLSEELSCITCHHPHHSIEATKTEKYNNACNSCHGKKVETLCSATAEEIKAANNDCVSCHMQPSGSIDIPHVNITDHYISKVTAKKGKPMPVEQKEEITRFLGLDILTKENPTPLDMAKGYIALYDKFVESAAMLDSAFIQLSLSKAPIQQKLPVYIHYYFARNDFEKMIDVYSSGENFIPKTGWTNYRIGEAYLKTNSPKEALPFLEQATEKMPYNLDFQEKLGSAYILTKKFDKARTTYAFILKENPKRKVALCNLGYLNVLTGKLEAGLSLYEQALKLDPDYEQAIINKAGVLVLKQQTDIAAQLLRKVLRRNPYNQQAIVMLQKLQEMN